MSTAVITRSVAALIPCRNEERGIGAVIQAFPRTQLLRHGFSLDIVVIDNASTDRTAELARDHGARVVYEPTRGKGNAMRRAFHEIRDADFVVMLDGDDTYLAGEIFRLIELIDSGFCDAVVGSRLGGRIVDGSMPLMNRAGNWLFSHIVRALYRVNVTDVLTGYFAWRSDVLIALRDHIHSQGFTIEMEMITKMARMGYDVYSVPITYRQRAGGSHLRPVSDGARILVECFRNIAWRPPQVVPAALSAASLIEAAATTNKTAA